MGTSWRKNIGKTPYGNNQEKLSQFDVIDEELLDVFEQIENDIAKDKRGESDILSGFKHDKISLGSIVYDNIGFKTKIHSMVDKLVIEKTDGFKKIKEYCDKKNYKMKFEAQGTEIDPNTLGLNGTVGSYKLTIQYEII